MIKTDYAAPRLEELLLAVEAGFAGSFEIPEKASDDGFEDTY